MKRLLPLVLLVMATAAQADIRVAVSGVDEALRENVLAMLSVQEYRARKDLTEAMVQRLHARAPEEIRRALMPFGYYDVEIESSLLREGNHWRASYRIRPGRPVQIDNVNVVIDGDEQARAAFADITPPFRRGDRLLHSQYESLKSRLLARANATGYLDAHFTTQRLAVNPATRTADIELVLATGEQYFFGDIDITQQILDDDFVRRFLPFEAGDPFDFDKLLDFQYALTDSDYFATVNVEPLRAQAEDQHVPVAITAREKKRSRYTAGLGYGTDTGPRITIGFQRRYVNRRGHRLGMETMISDVESSFATRYIIPLKDPVRENFQLFFGTVRQDLGDAESRRLVLAPSRVRILGDWEQTFYLRLEDETSILPGREFETLMLVPGGTWSKTRADDLFYTRSGYRLFGDLRFSHDALGAESEFVRLHIIGKRIFPLGERLRLLLRAEAGAILLADETEMPVSQRFFAGGDQSVRGFDYNRLATRDADGNVVGGRYLATGSAEIEYRFAESWAMAAFSDTGNAMDDPDDKLETSYGLGLRWLSPVGVLRFDVAAPITGGGDSFRLHISIGPDL